MLTDYPRIRHGLYLLGLFGAVAAPFVIVAAPEYGPAVSGAAAVLTTAALGTAASNITQQPPS